MLYIVIWKAYGEWKATTKMWPTAGGAQRHADTVLKKVDYYEHVTVVPIEVPSNTGTFINEDKW
jgi:hypothetical protein